MFDVQQVTDSDIYHGEGPCWSTAWGGLRFVDMLAGDVLQLDADTGAVGRTHVGEVAAVIRPRSSGGSVLALKDRFVITDDALTDLRTLAAVDQPDGVRLNEGGCDPDGRFYCGSMAYAETAHAGTFYRLDPDGQVAVVQRGVTISNGFDFSPDGTRAYYVDTLDHGIDIFDYSPESGLTDRRRWVDIPAALGGPDGLVVDGEGGVWLALMGGGAVRRYAPDATLDAVVELPVQQVTACTFGGDDLATLYITTSQIAADLQRHPASGALFSVDPGVRGRPTLTFAA